MSGIRVIQALIAVVIFELGIVIGELWAVVAR